MLTSAPTDRQDSLGSVGNPASLPFITVRSPAQAAALGTRRAAEQTLQAGLQAGIADIVSGQADQDGPAVLIVHRVAFYFCVQ
jgi:hypothetical protein